MWRRAGAALLLAPVTVSLVLVLLGRPRLLVLSALGVLLGILLLYARASLAQGALDRTHDALVRPDATGSRARRRTATRIAALAAVVLSTELVMTFALEVDERQSPPAYVPYPTVYRVPASMELRFEEGPPPRWTGTTVLRLSCEVLHAVTSTPHSDARQEACDAAAIPERLPFPWKSRHRVHSAIEGWGYEVVRPVQFRFRRPDVSPLRVTHVVAVPALDLPADPKLVAPGSDVVAPRSAVVEPDSASVLLTAPARLVHATVPAATPPERAGTADWMTTTAPTDEEGRLRVQVRSVLATAPWLPAWAVDLLASKLLDGLAFAGGAALTLMRRRLLELGRRLWRRRTRPPRLAPPSAGVVD